jgi:serine/threonine protein kinase
LATHSFAKTSIIRKAVSGVVYRARLPQYDHEVAVKVLTIPSSDEAALTSVAYNAFLAEARQLADCHHANIARFVAAGCVRSPLRCAIVTEYIAGGTLRSRIMVGASHRLPLTWTQRLAVLSGACHGLTYLHTTLGLIHHDISAHTILADEDATTGILSDLGPTSVQTTQAPTLMSPEAMRGKAIFATDVFALGVVILETLSGRPAEGTRPIATQADTETDDIITLLGDVISEFERESDPTNLLSFVDQHLRLVDPTDATPLFGLAIKCISHVYSQRPTATGVFEDLADLLESAASVQIEQQSSRTPSVSNAHKEVYTTPDADAGQPPPTSEKVSPALQHPTHEAVVTATPEAIPIAAAEYAYTHYYKEAYATPDEGCALAFYMDLEPVHGVERPNHGLANAVRKAALIPSVAKAFATATNTIEMSESMLRVMQVAIIFETSARKSDIGYSDSNDVFLGYHHASCAAFEDYARSRFDDAAVTICLEALQRMYMDPISKRSIAIKQVFEACHDLDLCRCYSDVKMNAKIELLGAKLGQHVARELAAAAERAVVATGDRLLFSIISGNTVEYNEEVFPGCSSNAMECFDLANKALSANPIATSPDLPQISPSTPLKRLSTSRYKRLLTAQTTKWDKIDWDDLAIYEQRKTILDAVRALVEAECARQNVDWDPPGIGKRFFTDLCKIAETESNIEQMSVRLWTSPLNLNGRELCFMINDAIRSDDEDRLMPAVTLTAMIQRHLNGKRREFAKMVEPDGTNGTVENTCFRGAGLPKHHIPFFEAMQKSGEVYRVPQFLACSLKLKKANGFLRAEDRIPKDTPRVLFTIKLDPDYDCMHVNYLNSTEVPSEAEYLFSAYSAFRVVSVEPSKEDPTNYTTPHRITIKACIDNKHESEDCPTSPWH